MPTVNQSEGFKDISDVSCNVQNTGTDVLYFWVSDVEPPSETILFKLYPGQLVPAEVQPGQMLRALNRSNVPGFVAVSA